MRTDYPEDFREKRYRMTASAPLTEHGDDPCGHPELDDHGTCLLCGEDRFDDVVSRAEYFSDNKQER